MNRYEHQISLPTIGEAGQQRLRGSSVLVIGAGGLGCPVMSYLSGAGIGKIGILDGDIISLSNLHRQTIYMEENLGQLKSIVAAEYLQKRNTDIIIQSHDAYLTSQNATDIIQSYDLILDCTDNIKARYLINDTCMTLGKTWIYAALHQYEGQLSVFNHHGSGSYRCLFPQSDDVIAPPTCSDAGILPTVAGMLGIMQANEAIKIILQSSGILSNTLLILDMRNYDIRKMTYKKLGQKIYRPSIGGNTPVFEQESILCSVDDIQPTDILIDIRDDQERWDHPIADALTIDIQDVEKHLLAHTKQQYIIICSKGKRSNYLVERLQYKGITHVKSLEGGASSSLTLSARNEK